MRSIRYRAGPVLSGTRTVRASCMAQTRSRGGASHGQNGAAGGENAGGPPGERGGKDHGPEEGQADGQDIRDAAGQGEADSAIERGPSASCGAPHFRRSAVETGRRIDQSPIGVEGDAVSGIGTGEGGKQEIAGAAQQEQHGVEQHQPPDGEQQQEDEDGAAEESKLRTSLRRHSREPWTCGQRRPRSRRPPEYRAR